MQPQSKRLIDCPGDELLLSYGRKELSDEQYLAVSSHLLFCDVCLEYLNLLATLDGGDAESSADAAREFKHGLLNISVSETVERFRARRQRHQVRPVTWEEFRREGRELRVGQIWRPKSKGIAVPDLDGEKKCSVAELDSQPHLVVITSAYAIREEVRGTKYHVIRVAPIDADVDCVADDDILVGEDESPLGYRFLLQTWNEQVMLRENLECLLGEFNETQATIMERLEIIGAREYREGAFSLEAVIMKGLYSDPVMRYRAREYEDTAYLRTPVDAIRSAHESLEGDSVQEDGHKAELREEERSGIISEILRSVGVLGTFWLGGWKANAASASEGVRKPQVFWNSDESLSATLEPTGKKMLLRIESKDEKWESALVPFSWKSVLDSANNSHCVFALLAKDEVKRGSYVAEIELGELREIEGTMLPDGPFSLKDLRASMSDIVRESIMRALSNHELDAWKELSEREDIDQQVCAAIHREIDNY